MKMLVSSIQTACPAPARPAGQARR